MKKITAYKCDWCGKVLHTHSGMGKHEKRCFRNPDTRSCIICRYLGDKLCIKGAPITGKEEEILKFKVPGTFYAAYDRDPMGDGEEYLVLNDEYEYLYEAEPKNYCLEKKQLLGKLKTKCYRWGCK